MTKEQARQLLTLLSLLTETGVYSGREHSDIIGVMMSVEMMIDAANWTRFGTLNLNSDSPETAQEWAKRVAEEWGSIAE